MTARANRQKTIRVALEKTKRTDIMCIACGRFHAELAIVVDNPAGFDPFPQSAGVHRACVTWVHRKRQRKVKTPHATEATP